METPGYRTSPGDGHLSIMDGGIMTITTDGHGSPVTNGRLPGYRGEAVAVITAGHRWALGSTFIST